MIKYTKTSAEAREARPLRNLFGKLINLTIDAVHRVIAAYRAARPYRGAAGPDLSKFTLTFEDRFEGASLDPVWDHTRQGARKGGYWDAGQTLVRDGRLVIRAEYKEDGRFGPGWYCGRIDTRRRFEQTYGYFECRCILPAAQGLWAAFWLSSEALGAFVPGTKGTEIDVFESPLWYRGLKGKDNALVTSNLHYGGYGAGHRYRNVSVAKANDPYRQFNTYGVEWNETGYIFYVNGRETGRSRFGGVSAAPEYMQLSVEIDGVAGRPFRGWSGLVTRNAPGTFPADFVVDYVRVYQYTEKLTNGS